MSEVILRKVGRTGRITLNRPQALNAVTHDMVRRIAGALPGWAADPEITMLVIDGAGERAFSAGGDLVAIHDALAAGDFATARAFWRDEYAMNAALFRFPKPVASFLNGFTMGGGVGIGCHGSHRVVGETSKIAMPECGIGLIPDVGGTLLLGRAPGRLGEYLGTTGLRMGPGDAILAGFADYFLPEDAWPGLIARLEETGDWEAIDRAARPAPEAPLAVERAAIDAHFGGETLRDILTSLRHDGDTWAKAALARLGPNAPLAMACTIELIHRARARDRIGEALRNEYRYCHRIAEQGDFREGIRAAIVDRDKAPKWTHESLDAAGPGAVSEMLLPLGADELKLEESP